MDLPIITKKVPVFFYDQLKGLLHDRLFTRGLPSEQFYGFVPLLLKSRASELPHEVSIYPQRIPAFLKTISCEVSPVNPTLRFTPRHVRLPGDRSDLVRRLALPEGNKLLFGRALLPTRSFLVFFPPFFDYVVWLLLRSTRTVRLVVVWVILELTLLVDVAADRIFLTFFTAEFAHYCVFTVLHQLNY